MKRIILLFLLTFIAQSFAQQFSVQRLNVPGYDTTRSKLINFGNGNYIFLFEKGAWIYQSRSTDFGNTWTPSNQIFYLGSNSSWDVLKTTNSKILLVYKGTDTLYVYTTTNTGISWNRLSFIPQLSGLSSAFYLRLTELKNNRLALAFQSLFRVYIIYSENEGVTWNTTPASISITSSTRNISVNSYPDGTYIILADRNGDIIAAKSTNLGVNWTPFYSFINTPQKEDNPVFAALENGKIRIYYNLERTSALPNYLQKDIVFIESTDNGNTWSSLLNVTKYQGNDVLISIFDENYSYKAIFLTDRYRGVGYYNLALISAEPNSDLTSIPVLFNSRLFRSGTGEFMIFQATIYDEENIESVYLISPNSSIQLYDDGQHFDEQPNDNIYGNSVSFYDLNFTNVIAVNKLMLPFNNSGVLADVPILVTFEIVVTKPQATIFTYSRNFSLGTGLTFEEGSMAYSGGFALTGYNGNFLWSNGIMTASRIQDYRPGTAGSNPNDTINKVYWLRKTDLPFGPSWQEWRHAVSLGAYYYDGDGDGIYNPIDKNNNGVWDYNEDRPDLLGDITAWCVYNDGVPPNIRRYTDVPPMGIEVRQTLFAVNVEPLKNTIFVRYSILNKGTVNSVFDSVMFSLWTDGDIGEYTNDLASCDTSLQSAITYNYQYDGVYGINSPALFTTILQTPWVYTGNQNDTAYNYLGRVIGYKSYPLHKNLKVHSYISYYQSYPEDMNDPPTRFNLRYYTIGRNKSGMLINPCTWPYGGVFGGVNCAFVNPLFLYSGNPVFNFGWIQTTAGDVRTMLNVGPFKLEANKPVDIIVAYTVGRGTDHLNSITVARQLVQEVLNEYRSNFSTITSIDDENFAGIPKEFKLFQNYPNPFNSKTKIEFTLPKSSEIKLILYDALGREISTLINERRDAGNYVYELDAAKFRLSSGVYFYKLKSEGNHQIKKMIYLK